MREKIKLIMQKKGVTATELSVRCKIRYQTITDFLNKGKNIYYPHFEKICKELNLELSENSN